MKQKKYLSMLLAFIMTFSLTARIQTAWAASPEANFTFDSATGTITGYTSTEGIVIIPSTIAGVPVKAIAEGAFKSNPNITSVSIPASVQSIGNSAFETCGSLSTITIENGVKSIGNHAFANTAAQSITLPDTITSVGEYAFSNCLNLIRVVLSENITVVPSHLFDNCSKLEQVTMSDNVTTIMTSAFEDCIALKDIALPSKLKEIQNAAFGSCTSLVSASLPASITTVGSDIFRDCSVVEAVYFEGNKPSGINDLLLSNANSNCKIYYKADSSGFDHGMDSYQTVPLYRMTIGTVTDGSISINTVTGRNIDNTWFEGNATVDLNVNPNANMQLKQGSLKYNNGLDHPITGTSFTMPNSEVTLSAEFMTTASTYYNVSIETVTGGSITKNLVSAAPDEIINLTVSPEQGNKLKEGTLKYTFNGQAYTINGSSFVMPAGNVSIAAEFEATDYVFDAYTGTITKYTGTGDSVVIPSTIDGVKVIAIGDRAFDSCSTLISVVIPDGVITIGEYVFNGCYRLVSAKFPNSVKNMEIYTFSRCTALTSVNLPTGITEIPKMTFFNCSSLKSIIIPDNIKSIGEKAFYGCTSLEYIILPEKLTTIDNDAFLQCLTLVAAQFSGNAPSSFGTSVFEGVSSDFEILYKVGGLGFETPSWNGYSCKAYDPTLTFTLTYDGNGSTSGSAPVAEVMHTGERSVILGTGVFTKTDAQYYYWSTKADGTGKRYFKGDRLYMGTENVTLYAQWINIYSVNIGTLEHGKMRSESKKAGEGDDVILTILPDAAWNLKQGTLKIKDMVSGTEIPYQQISSDELSYQNIPNNEMAYQQIPGAELSEQELQEFQEFFGFDMAHLEDVPEDVLKDIALRMKTVLFTMPAADVIVTAEFEQARSIVTDADKVAVDKAYLGIGYKTGDNASSVTQNLSLSVTGAVYGSTISWQSNNPAVISDSGMVTRQSSDANVTVTASVYNNDASDTKSFNLTVLKLIDTTGGSDSSSGSGSSSGSDSSSGSGSANAGSTSNTTPQPSPSSVTVTETAQTENTPPLVTGTITTEAKSDSDKNAAAVVTESQVIEAINKAVATASQKSEDTVEKVDIKVTAPAEAKSVETTLPKAAIDAILDDTIDSLTVSTPIAVVNFDAEALSTVNEQAVGDINITVSKVDTVTLSEEAKKVVGDRPVFNFSVTSGGKTISEFGGKVKVSIPYTLKPGEDADAVVIYYINANGNLEIMSHCKYDPTTKMVTFTTNHFSEYAVGYNKVNFKDVATNAWYASAVTFVAAREITTGIDSGNYGPEDPLTRGQFLVMVMKAYGIKVDENLNDNFADAGNTYYTHYLATAKKMGITGGVGNNNYAPDKEITRQEMFTLLYNTLKRMGELPSGTTGKELKAFSDANQIEPWAKDAMTLFVKTGTVSGSGANLNPEGSTNRAQMAQVLYNLLSK